MDNPRILSVGQCSFDHGIITRHLGMIYGAQVAGPNTMNEALVTLRAGNFNLVLVNRVFDGNGSAGLDLVRAIKADPELADIPVMLVSNYQDAQAEARSLGACRASARATSATIRSPRRFVFARTV